MNKNTEPVITTAGVTSAASALVVLLVAFGVPLTKEQTTAILGLVAVAAPLIVISARRWTVPAGTVVERVKDGKVIAGEASEIATGRVIRDVGALHDFADETHDPEGAYAPGPGEDEDASLTDEEIAAEIEDAQNAYLAAELPTGQTVRRRDA